MVKDFTLIIITVIVAVVILTYKAFDMGFDGAILGTVFTFLGIILGAVTTHYKLKWDNNRPQPPGDVV